MARLDGPTSEHHKIEALMQHAQDCIARVASVSSTRGQPYHIQGCRWYRSKPTALSRWPFTWNSR
jgi:hypothetical protein